MLNTFSSRASDSLLKVIDHAVRELVRQNQTRLGTEHLLLGLACEPDTLASRALASMKIDAGNTQMEVDQYLRQLNDAEPSCTSRYYSGQLLGRLLPCDDPSRPKPTFSDMAVQALNKAEEYSYFFGEDEIDPAHLLLGILDLREAGANKIFEEMSTNLTFLRRQVMHLTAQKLCSSTEVASLHTAVIEGLKSLASKHEASLAMVIELAEKSGNRLERMPTRASILHMVCTAYLGEFLYTQVAFQRYLLEETLLLLNQRAGGLDKETSAAVVSSSAQNIRTQVRSTLEYLWSHEFRLIQQMFDEAEHDLIGSIIEDLWWAQSEEMAIHKSFSAALEDHRRPQLLSLQKRRIEIANRLIKLKGRLEDTLRQCFQKRSLSA